MMRFALLIFFCGIGELNAAQNVGGGDQLRLLFEDARRLALSTLQNARSCFELPRASPGANWIRSNYDGLLTDIALTPYVWTESSQASCAQTAFESRAPLMVSFQACRSNIVSLDLTAKLLIHESTHHLGIIDETFADHVALESFKYDSSRCAESASSRTDPQRVLDGTAWFIEVPGVTAYFVFEHGIIRNIVKGVGGTRLTRGTYSLAGETIRFEMNYSSCPDYPQNEQGEFTFTIGSSGETLTLSSDSGIATWQKIPLESIRLTQFDCVGDE